MNRIIKIGYWLVAAILVILSLFEKTPWEPARVLMFFILCATIYGIVARIGKGAFHKRKALLKCLKIGAFAILILIGVNALVTGHVFVLIGMIVWTAAIYLIYYFYKRIKKYREMTK